MYSMLILSIFSLRYISRMVQIYLKYYESVYNIKIISLTVYEIMFIENFTVITVHPFGAKHICRKLNKWVIKETKIKEKKMQSVSHLRDKSL